MTKFCQNCGTPYEEGTAFCSNCGNNLSGVPAAPKKKSAITLDKISELATKRAKALMIIVLVVSLLIGLTALTGSFNLTLTKLTGTDVIGVKEVTTNSLYNESGAFRDSAPYLNVLTFLYGIALLGAAVLTGLSLLEKACGGKGDKIYKLATLIAAGSTLTFVFLSFCFSLSFNRYRDSLETCLISVPISAWVCAVFYSAIAFLQLRGKKED